MRGTATGFGRRRNTIYDSYSQPLATVQPLCCERNPGSRGNTTATRAAIHAGAPEARGPSTRLPSLKAVFPILA
jgi:hypothetical protein